MTTNWKRTRKANGARGRTPGGASVFVCGTALCRAQARRSRRSLRWKKDAVCRDASADAKLRDATQDTMSGERAESAGSSLTRTNFYASRIQTQPQTRKETPNTTQEKKGKQQTNQVTISQEPRNLSLTTKEKKLWQD